MKELWHSQTLSPRVFLELFGRWRSLLLILLAATATLAVHYAGFLFQLPNPIKLVVASRFAKEFLAIGSLYALTAVAAARLIALVLIPVSTIAVAILLRMSSLSNIRFARRYCRTRKWLHERSLILTALTAIAIFFTTYIGENDARTLAAFALASGFALVLTTFSATLLKPASIPIRTRKARTWKGLLRAAPPILVITISISLALSFVLGLLRLDHLQLRGERVWIVTPCARIKADLLLSAGETFLLSNNYNLRARYYVIGKDFAIYFDKEFEVLDDRFQPYLLPEDIKCQSTRE